MYVLAVYHDMFPIESCVCWSYVSNIGTYKGFPIHYGLLTAFSFKCSLSIKKCHFITDLLQKCAIGINQLAVVPIKSCNFESRDHLYNKNSTVTNAFVYRYIQ